MKLLWGSTQRDVGGVAGGYTRVTNALRAAVYAAGATPSLLADVVVHVGLPHRFLPIPGKTNVLVTMWESADLPPHIIDGLAKADRLIVPSEWNRRTFARHTDRPVHVVPLGIDTTLFARVMRAKPTGRPFRWLCLGVASPRKGWPELLSAWNLGRDGRAGGIDCFARRADVELYCKMTLERDHDPAAWTDADGPASALLATTGDVTQTANVIIDNRTVSDAELLGLYASADGFVFPSHGEGWGLPLLEAMATGLPCVTICAGGVTAYADSTVCIPVRTRAILTGRIDDPANTRERMWAAEPTALRDAMGRVVAAPFAARELGKRAARRAQRFPWSAAGRGVLRVCADGASTQVEEEAV